MVQDKECYVIVTDVAGNSTQKSIKSRTKLYRWAQYKNKSVSIWGAKWTNGSSSGSGTSGLGGYWWTSYSYDSNAKVSSGGSVYQLFNYFNEDVTGKYFYGPGSAGAKTAEPWSR